MSILSKIGGVLKSVAQPLLGAVGNVFGGPIGGTVGGILGGAIAGGGTRTPTASMGSSMLPSLGGMGRMLTLPGAGAVGVAVGAGVRGAKAVYSAAAGYCRKHPQWCSTIGGIAAVEAMISRGELPIPKRRRGKGISATELKNFRRVAKFTSRYCAPVKRAMKAPAMRGKSCQ
jgi:hypothetical protein